MRLLADSSIWIDHLRRPSEALAAALRERRLLTHPFVLGEVAMGSLARRGEVLAEIGQLRQAAHADDSEVLSLVARHRLFGTGLGLIDAHLLASCLLTPDAWLWTRDRRLHEAAERLGVAMEPDKRRS
jgi:predicted nucleic acid-binding protein